jgi:hypothetical protein
MKMKMKRRELGRWEAALVVFTEYSGRLYFYTYTVDVHVMTTSGLG